MKVAERQDDLQFLGQLLQKRLQSKFPQAVPRRRAGEAQGAQGAEVEKKATQLHGFKPLFLDMEKQKKELCLGAKHSRHKASLFQAPEFIYGVAPRALSSAPTLFLDLRVADQNQPYATHSFMLQPPISLPVNRDGGAEGECSARLSLSTSPPELSSAPKALEAPARFKLPILVAVACAGLATSLSFVYLLTRPCVIGECKPIQTAQQMSQESTRAAQRAKSEQELVAAQQHLAEASVPLQTIPRWSPLYQEAQQLSQTLSTQSTTLNQAVTALQKASAATQKSQNPPHTAQEWQAIQALWRETIASLEAVPRNSAVYPLAQQKLPLYRASLKSVDKQLNVEQQATKKLKLALVTAQVATTRQSAAQSLQNWQQVQSTWQVVVNELASIPENSTRDKEAQQLLQNYRSKLLAVRDRTTSEQVSALAYNQAVRLANLAKSYEQQNQLATAVTNWSQALNAAKKVPTGTFYHSKAQPLLNPYTTALKQAEEKLRIAKILQKTDADLKSTCSGELRFCNYSLQNQGITVQLTSDYERVLERIFMTAAAYGDSKSQAAVALHYQILQQALQAISYNVTLPLLVYDSKGSPILIYNP